MRGAAEGRVTRRGGSFFEAWRELERREDRGSSKEVRREEVVVQTSPPSLSYIAHSAYHPLGRSEGSSSIDRSSSMLQSALGCLPAPRLMVTWLVFSSGLAVLLVVINDAPAHVTFVPAWRALLRDLELESRGAAHDDYYYPRGSSGASSEAATAASLLLLAGSPHLWPRVSAVAGGPVVISTPTLQRCWGSRRAAGASRPCSRHCICT